MKSGTIAIIALSIVLVLSLVTTITLAYFTATRNVVTTVQFANGVKLQLSGVYNTGSTTQQDSPASTGFPTTPVTLYWKAAATENGTTVTDTNSDGNYTGVDGSITFENVNVRVLDSNAYVAVRVQVNAVSDPDAQTPTPVDLSLLTNFTNPVMANGWVKYSYNSSDAAGDLGWFMYGTGTTMSQMTAPATYNATGDDPRTAGGQNGYNAMIQSWQLVDTANNAVNEFAGLFFTCKIIVFASNTQAGLNEQVTAWNTDNAGSDTTAKVVYATAYVAP